MLRSLLDVGYIYILILFCELWLKLEYEVNIGLWIKLNVRLWIDGGLWVEIKLNYDCQMWLKHKFCIQDFCWNMEHCINLQLATAGLSNSPWAQILHCSHSCHCHWGAKRSSTFSLLPVARIIFPPHLIIHCKYFIVF